MSRSILSRFAAVLFLLVSVSGCVDDVGGGVSIEPEIRIKVDELDDEDVATLEGQEAGSVDVQVLSPAGQVIAPPEQRGDE